jgi:hypothetical protein
MSFDRERTGRLSAIGPRDRPDHDDDRGGQRRGPFPLNITPEGPQEPDDDDRRRGPWHDGDDDEDSDES